MKFLRDLFKAKDEPIKNYTDFWNWFSKNAAAFYSTVKNEKNIEKDFLDKLSPKLGELKDGFYYLTGMLKGNTAELVITADGLIKNIVFVEELVMAAPEIPGWKFTALKPALNIQNVRIHMANYIYDKETLSFFSNDNVEFPDEINITIVHKDFNEKDKNSITNGIYIFLDNYIGELNTAISIDNITIGGTEDIKRELVPISKLKDFLIWREKEFTEKYEGVLQNTQDAEFSILEAELDGGNKLIATINTDLLNWDGKASHPWIVNVEIPFKGGANSGMPNDETYQFLNDIEDKILADLKDHQGYLNIGRQTAKNMREIYFACKDFRKPSKVLYQFKMDHPDINIEYDIYKDKYWRSFNKFRQD